MNERLQELMAQLKLVGLDHVGILSRMEGIELEMKNTKMDEEYLAKLTTDLDDLIARLRSNKALMMEIKKGMDELRKDYLGE
jgi:hypothetical protein